ncbi:class II fructose-bisphosphate aldolase [Komagataeibacter europaeus]|uniref:class II fructose-bisphosphate aldolase n=1 Tax=Komagataeibacter europaeus TaxID=33995 RepID=UPI000317B194|nr:class II fructose-bisphosphate aldolase [Komagataeibacter europaeus]GBQ52101.1 fructose-bisphosphate aldolase [Komagataeibacter europaeus LMG 18890]
MTDTANAVSHRLGLKPGVVTGADYRRLVETCRDEGYALPAVNVVGTDSINAVLEAAARNRADVIIQLSNGGARFYAGEGMKDADQARVLGAVAAARHVHTVAAAYGVCVILHTDHADRKLLPWISGLIDASEEAVKETGRPLFSSHMIDLSAEPLEDNIAECATFLRRMAPLGIGLEIELGVTGGEEDGVGHDVDDGADNAHLYTQPEDVLKAYEALSPLGFVTIAASFGNVHGVYAPGNVKLRPEILRNSQAAVAKATGRGEKPLALVFHGGSGSEQSKITEAVSYGVFKMNIDTDIQFAFASSIGRYVHEHAEAFSHQIAPGTGKLTKKLYDPRKWLRVGEQGIVARLEQSFADLGATGRTVARAI